VRQVDERRPSIGGAGADGRFVLASATVLMALAGAFFLVPLLVLAAVPLAVLVYRNGYRAGTVTAIVTLVVVALAQQPLLAGLPATISDAALQAYALATMISLVTMGLIGMVIGGAWREGASWTEAFWLGAAAALIPFTLVWAGARLLYDVDLVTAAFQRWAEMVRGLVAEAARLGLTPAEVDMLEEAVAQTEAGFALVRPLVPGFAAVGAIVASFIDTSLAGWMLARLGHPVPAMPPFAGWRFPRPLAVVWVAAEAALLLQSAGRLAGLPAVENALMVLSMLFALQGAAVAWHWLRGRRIAAALKVVLLVAVYWRFPYVLIWTGVLDAFLDFRRLTAGGGAGGAPAP